MPLLKYGLDTGAIAAVIQGSSLALTQAQMVPEDATYGYLLTEDEHDPRTWQEQYAIVDGDVSPKTALTITATPNPFAADGVGTCAITVTPFQACTLLVNGTPYTLVEEDATVLLTSDVPATFAVSLAADVTAWALPLTVEAS